MKKLPDRAEVIREIVKLGGLHAFIRKFWKVVEPGAQFVDNWHIGAMAEHCEAVTKGEIRKLVVNVPPGHMKSLTFCVFWPAWVWSFRPSSKWMFASADPTLVTRDAEKTVKILRDPLFCSAWPGAAKLDRKIAAMSRIKTEQGGLRFGTSMLGQAVGWHADFQVIDDPIKPKDARNPEKLAKVSQIFNETFSTRSTDAKRFARVIVMQRLADNDLAGECLEKGYEHLCLMAEHVPGAVWDRGSSIQSKDPRTEPGELLFPERFGAEAIKDIKKDLNSPAAAEAQLQQNPTPDKGDIFQKDWLSTSWESLPPARLIVQSWDLTFKATGTSRVAWALFSFYRGKFYLEDFDARKMSLPQSLDEIRAKQIEPGWQDAHTILIEAKANGDAAFDTLKISDPEIASKIKMVTPKGSKIERAIAQAPNVERGNLLIPPNHPKIEEFRGEMVKFPKADNDDLVDVTTQALEELSSGASAVSSLLSQIKANR